jgi:hypothetical protein
MHAFMGVYYIGKSMQIALTAQNVGRKGINRLDNQKYLWRFYDISF